MTVGGILQLTDTVEVSAVCPRSTVAGYVKGFQALRSRCYYHNGPLTKIRQILQPAAAYQQTFCSAC